MCPYLVFACQNEESKYDRKDFLYGNILDKEFNLLKRINEYKFPKCNSRLLNNSSCESCNKGCKAIKIAYGLSIYDNDIEMLNKK